MKMTGTIFFFILVWLVSLIVAVMVSLAYTNSLAINVFTTIIIPAIVSAVSTAVPLYLGIVIGIPKEIDAVLDKLEERMKNSPTAERAMKMMELSDKLFGDDQAVEQITGFFKEARTLVSSPEAKSFFANVTDLMKQLSTVKKAAEKPKKIPKPTD